MSSTYRDYTQLAEKYRELEPFLSNAKYDYSYAGQCALTKVLMKEDYDIDIDILDGHLIPAVPSRVAYLKIVKRVLDETVEENTQRRGLDVGTGAYAIYAILANRLYNWEMVGVDIDLENVLHAQKIVEKNELKVEIVEGDGIVDGKFDFTMCNPPFYQSVEEIEERSSSKDTDIQRDAVVGTSNELVYEGGEVGFIKKLINQSKEHRKGKTWFSSMCGLKSSIPQLIDHLLEQKISNFHVQHYHLGKTRRWILLWSFHDVHPLIYHGQEFKNIATTVEEGKFNLELVLKILEPLELDIKISRDDEGDDSSIIKLEVIAKAIVWSRAYRRNPTSSALASEHTFIITSHEIYFKKGDSFRAFQSFHTYLSSELRRIIQ